MRTKPTTRKGVTLKAQLINLKIDPSKQPGTEGFILTEGIGPPLVLPAGFFLTEGLILTESVSGPARSGDRYWKVVGVHKVGKNYTVCTVTEHKGRKPRDAVRLG